ncbi:MAG: RHS repeat-associated core domain-containing protein, partial [Lachnospiraceae bacterium]|nr:RHS repeat-associated core domain-containing protein [Lachnospiraceae bacterium]
GKTSDVIKDFVIDYNSYAEENLMEYELFDEGLTYRYVYGVDKLGVTAYTIPNGSASVTTDEGDLPLYYHMDHMGSSEFLTSDVTQKITSWTSYDEWGNITHNAVLKCGERELDLVKTYTGHERDSVLGMYYAKARMYDTADKHGSTKANKLGDKRFTAVDPVKGDVRNPQTMVQYTYVLNNPLMYIDPLGEIAQNFFHNAVTNDIRENYLHLRKTLNFERRVYQDTDLGFRIYVGRVDIVDLKTGEVWDVKPASYNQGYKYNKLAMPQMQKYFASHLCPETTLDLKAGKDFAFSGSFIKQVGRTVYRVDYSSRPSVNRKISTQPDGLIIYTVTEIEKVPVQEFAREQISELSNQAVETLHEGMTVVIEGVVYVVVAVGTTVKLVRATAPLLYPI